MWRRQREDDGRLQSIIQFQKICFRYAVVVAPVVVLKVSIDSGVHYVKTMLVRFCDGLRHFSNDLRLVLDGLSWFLTILAIR